MERNLTLSGKVKLTRKELSMAVHDYLKNQNLNLKSKRLIYDVDGKKNVLNGVVIDVYQEIESDDIPDIGGKMIEPKESKQRNVKPGWKRKNVGIFKHLRELFDQQKKTGNKAMDFTTVFEDVKANFPTMNKKRLDVYLHDRRQLPGIKYSSKLKEINLNP